MTDLQQQLWDWQESIESPVAAKLLLVRAIQRLGVLEEVLSTAREVDTEFSDNGYYAMESLREAMQRADKEKP